MKVNPFVVGVLTLGLPTVAQAGPAVYPGCAVPSAKAGHHVFYVDPAKGSSSGDGSAAKPWHTLAEVLDPKGTLLSTQGHRKVGGADPLTPINPNGPIKAGDVLMLMSGNHGAVDIENATNADFVTVMAGPGQTPTVGSLVVKSSAKWLFQGIKFQGQTTAPEPADIGSRDGSFLVSMGRSEWLGASSDLVFTGDTFSSTDDTTQWTSRDWLLKPNMYAFGIGAPCTSLTRSRIYNVLNGIGMSKPNVLVQDNTIEAYSNDAIDVVTGKVIIKNNMIRGNISPSDINPWHPDGIQGWSAVVNGVEAVNADVVLDGNTILKTGDPKKSWMQGISIYDGRWDGLTIQNNIVVTDHWNGLVVYGADHLRVLNNTVLASYPQAATWIQVGPAKSGRHSTDVVVRNNISTNLVISDQNVTFDHNAVGTTFSAQASGKLVTSKVSDTAKRIIVQPSLASQLVNFNPDANVFDVRLRASSPLIGTGSATLAPAWDIAGKRRSAAVSPGVYAQ